MLNLLFRVGFSIKVAEQVDEDYRVGDKEIRKSPWYLTIHRENHQLVAEHQEELHQLDPGHVFLPPQVFLVLRAKSCYQVVRIHDNVHKGIQETN